MPPSDEAIDNSNTTSAVLSGYWLALARAAWVALLVLSIYLFVSGVLALASQQFNFDALVEGDPRKLGATEIQALAQLGLSLDSYRWLNIAIDFVFLVAYCFFPVIIFLRRSNDWMAIAVSAALAVYGATLTFSFQTLIQVTPTTFPARFLNTLSTVEVPILVYLFPDGRFIPRWTRWLTAFWLIWGLGALFIPAIDPLNWGPLLFYLLNLVGLATALYAQIYRYRRVSTLEQRQQTKWIVFGFGFATMGYALLPLLPIPFPFVLNAGANRVIFGIGFIVAIYLFQLAVPISFGFSIMRYRLWDIDFIINQSIVYFIVTILALVIFEIGSIFFNQFLESFVGRESPMALILPSIFAGVTLKPLHHRAQEFIDKRFFREKLATSDAFVEVGRELRNIIHLPELQNALVHRVGETLHLTHCAVFMRDSIGHFQFSDAYNIAKDEKVELPQDAELSARLEKGLVASPAKNADFQLLLPLMLPAYARRLNAELPLLTGILALGPRFSGQGYSREDGSLLLALADEVGTAIYVARMTEENRIS